MFSEGVTKINRLEIVKNEEMKNKLVNVFHFQMQVDIHVDSASVTGYFLERLTVIIRVKISRLF